MKKIIFILGLVLVSGFVFGQNTLNPTVQSTTYSELPSFPSLKEGRLFRYQDSLWFDNGTTFVNVTRAGGSGGGGSYPDSNFVSAKFGSITVGDTNSGDTIRIDSSIWIGENIYLGKKDFFYPVYSDDNLDYSAISMEIGSVGITTNTQTVGVSWSIFNNPSEMNFSITKPGVTNDYHWDTLGFQYSRNGVYKFRIDTLGVIRNPLDTLGASEYDPAAVAAATTKYVEVLAGPGATYERTYAPLANADSTGDFEVSGNFYNSPPHAAIYRNTSQTITATQNIWYKFAGFTTKDADNITVTGDSLQFPKGSFSIDFTCSFSGLNNEIWEVGVFKNNVLEEPGMLRYTSTSDVGNMSCPVYVESDGNDWISFRIRNTIDNDDPTILRFSAIVTTQHLTE